MGVNKEEKNVLRSLEEEEGGGLNIYGAPAAAALVGSSRSCIGASKADSRRKGGSKEPKNKENPRARDRK